MYPKAFGVLHFYVYAMVVARTIPLGSIGFGMYVEYALVLAKENAFGDKLIWYVHKICTHRLVFERIFLFCVQEI